MHLAPRSPIPFSTKKMSSLAQHRIVSIRNIPPRSNSISVALRCRATAKYCAPPSPILFPASQISYTNSLKSAYCYSQFQSNKSPTSKVQLCENGVAWQRFGDKFGSSLAETVHCKSEQSSLTHMNRASQIANTLQQESYSKDSIL